MLRDPQSGSKVWEAPDREIGKPGENRGKVVQPIALAVAEQEQAPAQRLARQSVPDQTVQALETLAHVGDSSGQIDACGWTQSKHGLHALQRTHRSLERVRIKIRMYLDPTPTWQHYCQPKSRVVLRRRFLGGQLHLHQPPGRRNWPTPSLPTPFLQMAIQCAEAQTPTPTKLAAAHTAAREFCHQLLNFCACTSFVC